MSVLTTCRIADAFGVHLIEIANYVALDYILNCAPGGIGVLELELPRSVNASLLKEDGRIGVWRAIDGRPPQLDNGAIYLIRYLDYGPQSIRVRAYHATSLLDRRIIAYDAGTSYTSKGPDFADDLIKEFVSQQMLSGIVGADRDGVETYADVSSYLTKQADLSLGASVSKAATRRRLLDVCVDLAHASSTAGTYLTFEIVAPTESTLELRTYTTQRGIDRRAGTANPVILSELRGNLENAHLVVDYSEAASMIIAGGQGEAENRIIGTAFDAARAGVSPFGRIERFRDASNVSTQAAVDDEADSQVRASRPIIAASGDLIETPGLIRGIDFDLGDMVTVELANQQYDVRLDLIRESVSPSGRKTTCGVRSVT